MSASIKEKLAEYNQTTLLKYAEKHPNEAQKIMDQLDHMGIDRVFNDFHVTMQKYNQLKAAETQTRAPVSQKTMHPPRLVKTDKCTAEDPKTLQAQLVAAIGEDTTPALLLRKNQMPTPLQKLFYDCGVKLMQDGKLAIVLLAGGQGSRLKFDGPKGCYTLSNLPGKPTVFQILCERLVALKKMTGAPSIPLYIMVSHQNGAATRAHIEEHKYFGLPPTDVIFFEQTVMPSFSEDGEALLEGPDQITRNPNGNGGLFESLRLTGKIDDMKSRNIECLHVIGVDNILVKMGDPLFIGACALVQVPVGNKCVEKIDPAEKVGVQGYVEEKLPNGQIVTKPCVLEYTEISLDQASQLTDPADPKSGLLYSAGNIVNHYFTLDHVMKILSSPDFEYHVAIKNLKVYDPIAEGPATVTGVKLEYFIFDSFAPASCVLALEADRPSEFSPVKNFDGPDSPQTATQDLLNLHQRYLAAANIKAPGCIINISKTYQGEGLEQCAGKSVDELVAAGILRQ
eukprot:Blabericola_migrator_1__6816@NODE_3451_length_1763_cov_172_451061_g2146_i0_p1_GENE_NODE_3451_length_1763_cov_172_451061_g2146_i0NODE_3451_length_1763_cov_172_451061_g2146_i0_p1_ORF_typecomplete_len511_score122_79UDPGP/PF01704_18/7_5e83_NODE_3451_length_1763_cov_172_451061_g2146_i01091641